MPMTYVNDPNDPNYVVPGTVPPVAEAVEPVKSSLKWLWWLLGLLLLGALLWWFLHNRTATEPVAQDTCTVENPCTINFRWWGGDARQALQLEAIRVFEEANPGIRINPEPTSLDGYFDALGIQMSAGNEPDVFALGGAWPLDYGRAGTLLELSNNPDINITPFPTAVMADATVDGRVYAVPTGGNATGLVINPRIFAEAGVALPNDDTWTWDEFISIANQISANTPDGVFGVEMRPQDMLGSFAAQRDGIGLYTEDGELNVSPETLAAYFEMIQELTDGGGMPPAAQQSELMNVGPEETLMGTGMGAMLFAPSNQIGAFATASGDDLQLIRIPGESEFASVGVALLPSQWLAVGANTSYPHAASHFVDWMVNSTEAGTIMGVDRGNPLNETVAAAIAPGLDPIQSEQVNYIARISQYAGHAIAQPPGAGEQPTISTSSQEEVAFGRMTPMQAAESWLSRMQTELDSAN